MSWRKWQCCNFRKVKPFRAEIKAPKLILILENNTVSTYKTNIGIYLHWLSLPFKNYTKLNLCGLIAHWVNNTFRKITDCFWRKHRHDSHVSKIAWEPLDYLFLNANKNVSVKPLSLVCITSFFYTIYSLRNVSVCGKHFVRCLKINRYVIHQPRSALIKGIISINDFIQ